jgi:hypothetical protein
VSLLASFIAALSATPYKKPEPVKAPAEDTIKISGEGMVEFGAAVAEVGKTLRGPEDVLQDDAATPERIAAKVDTSPPCASVTVPSVLMIVSASTALTPSATCRARTLFPVT